jgi:hypothetical protein
VKQETAGPGWASSGQPSRQHGGEHMCSLLTFHRRWCTRRSRRQSLVPPALQGVDAIPNLAKPIEQCALRTARRKRTVCQERAPHGTVGSDRNRSV